MDKTKVKAYFSILGDVFPLEEVTRILGVEPSETHKKGDEIIRPYNPNVISTKIHYRKEMDWKLSTGYQVSLDINEQLDPLLDKLEVRTKALQDIKEKYNLFYLFMVVIQVENNEKPAMYLESRIINFASEINAEIHFDLSIFN